MNLKSQRLHLVEITWEDLELVHALNSYQETDEFNTLGIPENLETTREAIRSAVEDKAKGERQIYCWIVRYDDEFVGEIGMNVAAKKKQRAEIFYSIIPEKWGRGYATEVVQTVIRFGFDQLNLHRIEAGVATENIRSIRVLEKVGMIREGTGRGILPIRGKWVDNYAYSILENDPGDY